MKTALKRSIAEAGAIKDRRDSKVEHDKSRGKAITRILVPIDLSRASLKAISYALAISRRFGAEVHFVHVIDMSQYLPPTILMGPGVWQTEWRMGLRKELEAVALKFSKPGEIAVHRLLEGRAYRQICQEARRLKVDLIVIATHGYTGCKRVLLGSTAERVVQVAPCPVLVVRKPYSDRTETNGQGKPFRIGKILIPVDFSAFSDRVLDLGVALARDLGAKVSLVHVLKTPLYPLGDQYAGLPVAALVKETQADARKQMQAMAAHAGVRDSISVLQGSPPEKICEHASHENVDLIIISTHGRSGLRHMLIGSVAERVARHAKCPVLVVPARWATRNPLPN